MARAEPVDDAPSKADGDANSTRSLTVIRGDDEAAADSDADLDTADESNTLVPATVPLCADSSVAASDRLERAIDYARDWRSAWQLGVDDRV